MGLEALSVDKAITLLTLFFLQQSMTFGRNNGFLRNKKSNNKEDYLNAIYIRIGIAYNNTAIQMKYKQTGYPNKCSIEQHSWTGKLVKNSEIAEIGEDDINTWEGWTEYGKKLTHFGTFNLVFLYLLFDYFYAIIVNNKNDKELYQALIAKLYDGRIEYLNNNNLNVVDVSPFQDFTFKCHGITEETIRSAMIKGILDRNKGKYKFNYKPKGTIGKIPEYNFLNTSGNQNLNKKNLILIKNI